MLDPQILPGLVLVGLGQAAVLVILLAVGLSRPGSSRAGLVAGGMPLALLPLAAATAYASWALLNIFSGALIVQPGATSVVVDACAALWRLERLACGAFAASCALGLLVGLLRFGGASAGNACSPRRGLLLVLLPVLGLALVGGLARQLGAAVRVTAAAIPTPTDDAETRKRADAVLESEGFGRGHLGKIPDFIGRSLLLGTFGGATALGILIGLALPGFILAWRIGFGAPFTALATGLWLAGGAAAGLVALGLFDPLAFR